jgi:hypothetical protein
MLKMAIGHTEEMDGALAAADVLAQCGEALDGMAPKAALLLASHDLEAGDFLSSVAAAYPDIALIGCTTIAPMSSGSMYAEGSTTLTMFASDVLDFSIGLGTEVSKGVASAAKQAVSDAAAQTDKPPALVIVTPTMEISDPAAITLEIGSVIGENTPVFGGGAVPDFPLAFPWVGASQFHGTDVVTDSLPVMLISGPLNVSVGVAHGWSPIGNPAIVTRSGDHKVFEVNNEPVLDFYRRYLGLGGSPSIVNPLAVRDDVTGRFYLRTALAFDEVEGSASFFGSIPEGATVQLTMATTDEILSGTDKSLAEALAGFPTDAKLEGVLVASCATRNLLLGARARGEIEHIRSTVGDDVSVSGFYAFGEIAPLGIETMPRFHNGTCVTAVIGT